MIVDIITLFLSFCFVFFIICLACLLLRCEDELSYHLLYFCKTEDNKKFAPCLTFSQFLAFYNLNPQKWILYRTSVCYLVNKPDNPGRQDEQEFHFTTYGEVCKYKKWFNRITKEWAKRNALRDLNVTMSNFTRDVRAEIEKNNAEAEAKIKQLMENLNIK